MIGEITQYELKDHEFEKIRRLIYEQCGINLHEGKRELVKARLSKRLREGNFKSFSEYFRYVTTEEGTDELINMIDSISTNLTYFFRENTHFDRLRLILEKWKEKKKDIRIWSAGCSTGEEPYSIAIVASEVLGPNRQWCSILATDISTRVLKQAITGIYPQEKIERVPKNILKAYFQYGTGKAAGYYRIRKEIRDMIEFRRFNLMDPFPLDFRFHIVFCRNVMIYFDKKTQVELITKFFHTLEDDGYLFVGHSESLTGLEHGFQYLEPSIYRKKVSMETPSGKRKGEIYGVQHSHRG
ncbi:MAG: protein-glutamate O-methyltransferase CheR [Syntrophales bacterium]|nr:protein-glutamate O-methyltransferase CheR [Syntrophales bacterium]